MILEIRSTSGRNPYGLRGLILCTLGKHRPGDASVFCCQRHSGHVDMPSLLQPLRPRGFLISFLIDDPQISARSVYEQRPQIPITLLGD